MAILFTLFYSVFSTHWDGYKQCCPMLINLFSCSHFMTNMLWNNNINLRKVYLKIYRAVSNDEIVWTIHGIRIKYLSTGSNQIILPIRLILLKLFNIIKYAPDALPANRDIRWRSSCCLITIHHNHHLYLPIEGLFQYYRRVENFLLVTPEMGFRIYLLENRVPLYYP